MRAALDRGARVTLLAASIEVALPDDPQLTVVRAVSTAELEAALRRVTTDDGTTAGFDALVMAAAVADFRPVEAAEGKLPRGDGLTLRLESTPDLLAAVAATARDLRPRPVLVGFAAETGSLERAPDKLRRKGVDLLVANDVAEPGSGFGTDTNRVTILAADGGRTDLPQLTKREVADRILDLVAAALDERDAAAQTASTPEPASEPA